MPEIVHVERGREIRLVGEPGDWLGAGRDARSLADGESAALLRVLRRTSHRPADGIFFAGPWIGEFGWELMRWQGGIRRLAQDADLYTIVMGDPGHELLYGYADEYWDVPASFRAAGLTRQCDHVLQDAGESLRLESLAYQTARELAGLGDVKLSVVPRRFRPAEQDWCELRSGWEPWRTPMPRPYCCLVPRQRGWNNQKNWPRASWKGLARQMAALDLNVAFVSSREELLTFCPRTTIHPRDALRRSVDLLCGAQFAVASESGGAFLSLLCGCPTLVFARRRWEKRITITENPLRTPVRFLGRDDSNFEVEEVADAAQAFMRDLPVPA